MLDFLNYTFVNLKMGRFSTLDYSYVELANY